MKEKFPVQDEDHTIYELGRDVREDREKGGGEAETETDTNTDRHRERQKERVRESEGAIRASRMRYIIIVFVPATTC